MRDYLREKIEEINKIFHDQEAGFYDEWHPEMLSENNRWDNFFQLFIGQATRPLNILDVGTGTGFVPGIMAPYLKNSDKITCIDISSAMLEIACQKLKKYDCQFEFVGSDGQRLDFIADKSLDLVTVNSVLHHLPGYVNFLAEVERVLRPGGILAIMHEPNRRFFNNKLLVFLFRGLSYVLGKVSFRTAGVKNKLVLLEKVNQELIKVKTIKKGKELSLAELQGLVDVWSPTATGKINPRLGFDPGELVKKYFPAFKIMTLKTYNHLGKIDVARNWFLRLVNGVFSLVFPHSGSVFCLIIKKPK